MYRYIFRCVGNSCVPCYFVYKTNKSVVHEEIIHDRIKVLNEKKCCPINDSHLLWKLFYQEECDENSEEVGE